MTSPSSSAPVKAYLLVEKKNSSATDKLSFSFNPEQLAFSYEVDLVTDKKGAPGAPGAVQSMARFAGKKPNTIDGLSLFFDSTATGDDVSDQTKPFVALVDVLHDMPTKTTGKKESRPRLVTLHWGSFASAPFLVKRVSVTYTYFAASGTPLRADVSLSFMEYQPDLATTPTNPSSGTPHPHAVHRVQPGETLDRISALHYAGDSTRWRALAEANGIEDPLALRPGALLTVPRDA